MADKIDDLKADANRLRGLIRDLGADIQTFKTCVKVTAKTGDRPPLKPIDFGEVIANVVISFRHLEDARMRLGKAIQHLDGGESIYDRRPREREQQQQ